MESKLLEDWPLSYTEYLARRTFLGVSGERIPEALKLIETAQRCQTNVLLPTAFYELACAWGTHWEDIYQNISPGNMARLSVGRARCDQRLRSLTAGNSSDSPLMWPSANLNVDAPLTIFKHRENFRCSSRCSFNILPISRTKLVECAFDGIFALTALQQAARADFTVYCKECKGWIMSVLENKIQELWENIPTDFDLPPIDPELYSKRLH